MSSLRDRLAEANKKNAITRGNTSSENTIFGDFINCKDENIKGVLNNNVNNTNITDNKNDTNNINDKNKSKNTYKNDKDNDIYSNNNNNNINKINNINELNDENSTKSIKNTNKTNNTNVVNNTNRSKNKDNTNKPKDINNTYSQNNKNNTNTTTIIIMISQSLERKMNKESIQSGIYIKDLFAKIVKDYLDNDIDEESLEGCIQHESNKKSIVIDKELKNKIIAKSKSLGLRTVQFTRYCLEDYYKNK